MALWAVTRNAAVLPGERVAAVVVQRTRKAPLSLVNDSVCLLPWPDHDPIARQATTRCGTGGGGSAAWRQAAAVSPRLRITNTRCFTGRGAPSRVKPIWASPTSAG